MTDQDRLFKALAKADALAQQGDQQAVADAKAIAKLIRSGGSGGSTPQPAVAAPAPPAASEQPKSGSIFDSVGQGLTFGFADEIAGATGAAVKGLADLPGDLARKFIGPFAGKQSPSFGEDYQGIRDSARSNRDDFRERAPTAALAGEIAGGLLTGGAGAARSGALAAGTGIKQLAGVGARQGGVYAAGASDAEFAGEDQGAQLAKDVGVGAGVGGLFGAALPVAGRGAKKLGNKLLGNSPLSRNARKQIQTLEDEGINLTAAQKSNSRALGVAETTLRDVPISGSPLAKAIEGQREKFQSKVLEMAGFADEDVAEGLLTPEGLARAKERFTQRYADKLDSVEVQLGQGFNDALDSVKSTYTSRLGGGGNSKFTGIIEDVRERAGSGRLTGQEYQKLRSEIGKFERTADPDTAALYTDVKSTLDDAFLDAAGSVTAKAKKEIDNDYAAFAILRDFNKKNLGGADGVASGNIPIGMLAKAAQRGPGSKKFKDFTRAGQAILVDKVGNSGTAQRLVTQSLFGGGAITNPVATVGGALLGRGVSAGLANPQAVARGAAKVGQAGTNLGLLSAAPAGGLIGGAPSSSVPSNPNDPRLSLLAPGKR